MTYWTDDPQIAHVLDQQAARIEREFDPAERQAVINRAARKLAAAVLTDPSMEHVDEARMANELRTEMRKRIN